MRQDRLFLSLNERYALGCDDLQWMLYRANCHDPSMTKITDWRPISFVRSTKAILLRCIREKGCKPSREAQAALDGLPPTFDTWKASMLADETPVAAPVSLTEAA
jgi:hypothetical protein